MQKRRIIIGGLLVLSLTGAGIFLLGSYSDEPAQQISETTVATRAENVPTPDKLSPPQQAQRQQEKPAVKPIKDVFIYSMEGEKVFVAAGSVTVDKKNHQWRAQIKNINRNGEAQSIQTVIFKQTGNQILTCNAGGKWRNIDEMDRAIFDKVVDISGTY